MIIKDQVHQAPDQPGTEITRHNMTSLPAAEMIAAVATALLREYGVAVFVIKPDDSVVYANHFVCFPNGIPPESVPDLAERPHRFVRPILGDGRPQFVGFKDGRLWEIEFIDEQSEEKPGS